VWRQEDLRTLDGQTARRLGKVAVVADHGADPRAGCAYHRQTGARAEVEILIAREVHLALLANVAIRADQELRIVVDAPVQFGDPCRYRHAKRRGEVVQGAAGGPVGHRLGLCDHGGVPGVARDAEFRQGNEGRSRGRSSPDESESAVQVLRLVPDGAGVLNQSDGEVFHGEHS